MCEYFVQITALNTPFYCWPDEVLYKDCIQVTKRFSFCRKEIREGDGVSIGEKFCLIL